MSQAILEIRQPKPLDILVEISPVKEGPKISNIKNEINNPYTSRLRWEDIIGLSWIFKDPLEEDW